MPLWEADVDQWWSVITTNVRGPFLMTRAVVPHMIAAGGGRIINLNSGAGTAERAELSAYCASKSALARITGGTHLAGGHTASGPSTCPRRGAHPDDPVDGPAPRPTEWTEPADVTNLVLALAGGELDAWSGRFVRAGVDTPATLSERAGLGLDDDARTLRLRPWGPSDPWG